MRVLLATYGSRGDVEPIVGLAVQLRALGADVRVCAPPEREFEELLDGVGIPMVPIGKPFKSMVRPAGPADATRTVTELIATQYDAIAAAAEGCDVLVATGMVLFATRSVAEKLGIRYVYATFCPIVMPSPHHPPIRRTGEPFPDGLDNLALHELDAQSYNATYGGPINAHRASIGLPPVDNVRDYVFTDHPWLASDPVLGPWVEPHGPRRRTDGGLGSAGRASAAA